MTEGVKWVRFTRRTDEPKLNWLEHELDERGIPNRRNGFSFHAPILEVPEDHHDAAWELLPLAVDDIPDDDERFRPFADYVSKSRREGFHSR